MGASHSGLPFPGQFALAPSRSRRLTPSLSPGETANANGAQYVPSNFEPQLPDQRDVLIILIQRLIEIRPSLMKEFDGTVVLHNRFDQKDGEKVRFTTVEGLFRDC